MHDYYIKCKIYFWDFIIIYSWLFFSSIKILRDFRTILCLFINANVNLNKWTERKTKAQVNNEFPKSYYALAPKWTAVLVINIAIKASIRTISNQQKVTPLRNFLLHWIHCSSYEINNMNFRSPVFLSWITNIYTISILGYELKNISLISSGNLFQLDVSYQIYSVLNHFMKLQIIVEFTLRKKYIFKDLYIW